MRIDIQESLYIQLEKLATKNFRTPKLQLDFILSNLFANGGEILSQNRTEPFISQPEAPKFNSFQQISTLPLVEAEKLNLDAEFDEVAKQTMSVITDEEENKAWSGARQAFEQANMKAEKAQPKLTPEQEEELRKGHEERKKNKSKVNIAELVVDVIKDNM